VSGEEAVGNGKDADQNPDLPPLALVAQPVGRGGGNDQLELLEYQEREEGEVREQEGRGGEAAGAMPRPRRSITIDDAPTKGKRRRWWRSSSVVRRAGGGRVGTCGHDLDAKGDNMRVAEWEEGVEGDAAVGQTTTQGEERQSCQ
jgi:hypothetical protein